MLALLSHPSGAGRQTLLTATTLCLAPAAVSITRQTAADVYTDNDGD